MTQKLIEYFNILFSYTRNYIFEEEKYLNKLRGKYSEQIENLINCVNNYFDEKIEENSKNYFPLIKIKELIEENNIQLKDKYVEFLFYFLKKFNDKDAKLEELKYSLLNDILEEVNENKLSNLEKEHINKTDEINNKPNNNIDTNNEKYNATEIINKENQEDQKMNEINYFIFKIRK